MQVASRTDWMRPLPASHACTNTLLVKDCTSSGLVTESEASYRSSLLNALEDVIENHYSLEWEAYKCETAEEFASWWEIGIDISDTVLKLSPKWAMHCANLLHPSKTQLQSLLLLLNPQAWGRDIRSVRLKGSTKY